MSSPEKAPKSFSPARLMYNASAFFDHRRMLRPARAAFKATSREYETFDDENASNGEAPQFDVAGHWKAHFRQYLEERGLSGQRLEDQIAACELHYRIVIPLGRLGSNERFFGYSTLDFSKPGVLAPEVTDPTSESLHTLTETDAG